MEIDEALEEEVIAAEEEGDSEISLHALQGLVNNKTIKVEGKVRNHRLMVLIDSGSTHNFLDEKITKKLGCIAINMQPLTIIVVNGEKNDK